MWNTGIFPKWHWNKIDPLPLYERSYSEAFMGSNQLVATPIREESGTKQIKKKLLVDGIQTAIGNEFTAQAWDFFSDATVEINSFYAGADINGVITDFPKTSDRYWSNLAEADVVEPHLPHVAAKTPTSTPSGTASAPRSPNGQPRVVASVIAPFMALLLAMYLPF
ncbi:hypothetical protein V6N11_009986 [Hibiscus sabdariffa]|uniref:glycerophosphodiester phosphodiesterase n=1 Tax=Hibiscus sabdariffa TaxID=183260 RepID=A0ABR2PDB5_9ROSI